MDKIKQAIGMVVALIGIISAVIPFITGTPQQQRLFIYLIAAALLITGLYLFILPIYRKAKIEKVFTKLGKIAFGEDRYSIRNADRDDVEWIADLELRVYGKQVAVPKATLLDWYSKNSKCYYIISTYNGIRIGHIDILPIKRRTLERLKAGEITEQDIQGDCLYSTREKKSVRTIYIESVIIDPPKGMPCSLAFKYLITNSFKLLSNISNPKNIESVHAIAASKAGEKMLTRFSFIVTGKKEYRKDKHNFYSARYQNVLSSFYHFFSR